MRTLRRYSCLRDNFNPSFEGSTGAGLKSSASHHAGQWISIPHTSPPPLGSLELPLVVQLGLDTSHG
jgi:hypothetical protein